MVRVICSSGNKWKQLSRSYWRAHGFQSLLSEPIKLFSFLSLYIEDIQRDNFHE